MREEDNRSRSDNLGRNCSTSHSPTPKVRHTRAEAPRSTSESRPIRSLSIPFPSAKGAAFLSPAQRVLVPARSAPQQGAIGRKATRWSTTTFQSEPRCSPFPPNRNRGRTTNQEPRTKNHPSIHFRVLNHCAGAGAVGGPGGRWESALKGWAPTGSWKKRTRSCRPSSTAHCIGVRPVLS